MLDLFGDYKKDDHLPPISETELSDAEVLKEAHALKKELKDKMLILGHHYQQDDIIEFADIRGDSLKLAQDASGIDKPYIVFCGVHFMAETADILTPADKSVILPDLRAGCSMADMANRDAIDKAWSYLTKCTDEKIVPVTYINCTAKLKAFVGENGGSICTSSNAESIIKWALDEGEKLLFFPDQHLGRNTCFKMGIPTEDMVIYDPNRLNGGLTPEQIQKAKVILWYGYCSVHQGFTAEQVRKLKKEQPDVRIIVHPECSFDVVQEAHEAGSTAYIINRVRELPAGSRIAVGTEINLVNRLNAQFPDKEVFSLSPYQCLCTTMYRVRPRWLLASFRAIKDDKPINIVKVDEETAKGARLALDKMLSLS
ncbi:MAG: quinolinate synthase NadA [Bdellovibrionota bacterium]|jgi:quinolinate synthase|nr:quinolinate synthase NadA [Bdellovibrionota bacterium]